MAKVFAPRNPEAPVFERTDQYFGRTRNNLERIAAADRDYVARVWQSTPFSRPYTGADEFPCLDLTGR
jgi:hypothetical protein